MRWEGIERTCAAIAAFDRASSAPPGVSLLSPSVRPGVFFQFLVGSGARGADGEEGAPTTRPGPVNASGSLELEQQLPMVFGRSLGVGGMKFRSCGDCEVTSEEMSIGDPGTKAEWILDGEECLGQWGRHCLVIG